VKARREGQVGPQIPIPPDLFAKYEHEDGEFSVPDVPRIPKSPPPQILPPEHVPVGAALVVIASWFCLRLGGLPIPRLSGYLCSGRLLRRALFSEKSRRVMLTASDEDAERISTFNRLNHVLLRVLFAFADLASYRVTVSAVFRGYFVDT
jgi:hypothetical protein